VITVLELVLAVGVVGILLVVRGLTQIARPGAGPGRLRRAIDSRRGKRVALGLVLVVVGYTATGLWIVAGYLAIGAGLLIMAAGVGLVVAALRSRRLAG
jgi:hypothetical protein